MPSPWPTAGELMTADPATLPHDAPLAKALGIMRTRGLHEVPVLRNARLAGMITFESIARRVRSSLSTKVENLLILPPLITPSTPLPEVAAQLLATGLRAAPVVGRKGELVGVISRTDLVRALRSVPAVARASVDAIASPARVVIREDEEVRHLLAQLRALEEHPLPVVDRKGRLVGAVGVSDLGAVLWRPVTGGKRDAQTPGSALDVEVGSIMHSPPVTVPSGTSAAEAAALMTREHVSSVFVVDGDRPARVVGQADLLGLVVGSPRAAGAPGGIEDCYVEITGLRGATDAALLADIDHLIAAGLRRIAKHLHPTLLTVHFAPHATHRTNDLTVEARLHTDVGIFYASHTGWNLMAGVAGLLEELAAQARRARENQRGRGRGRRGSGADATLFVDAELEAKIRSASGADESE
ncbi:MAG TPA: CBS domain-containing protein [Thermoplasmata archaeon]|nr:CBS domain-containing protein [Thermoplasmata archaeon]